MGYALGHLPARCSESCRDMQVETPVKCEVRKDANRKEEDPGQCALCFLEAREKCWGRGSNVAEH